MSNSSVILTLSLNTFIRYYSMDRSRLVGEIDRRMQQSGGYDFYKILADAVRAKIRGATDDEIQFILGRSSNPSEVSYNKAAFEAFLLKFGKKKGLSEFDKKGKVRLCDGELVVTTAPLFSVEASTGFSVYNIWATQTTTLDRARAGVGVYLMQRAFSKSAPNYDYKMFDAVERRTYGTANNAIPKAIDSFARSIVDLAKNS
ncbi:MAG: hypothetical protein V7727_11295 [Sneathiella sp.]